MTQLGQKIVSIKLIMNWAALVRTSETYSSAQNLRTLSLVANLIEIVDGDSSLRIYVCFCRCLQVDVDVDSTWQNVFACRFDHSGSTGDDEMGPNLESDQK